MDCSEVVACRAPRRSGHLSTPTALPPAKPFASPSSSVTSGCATGAATERRAWTTSCLWLGVGVRLIPPTRWQRVGHATRDVVLRSSMVGSPLPEGAPRDGPRRGGRRLRPLFARERLARTWDASEGLALVHRVPRAATRQRVPREPARPRWTERAVSRVHGREHALMAARESGRR
jgi:hypothetical protein